MGSRTTRGTGRRGSDKPQRAPTSESYGGPWHRLWSRWWWEPGRWSISSPSSRPRSLCNSPLPAHSSQTSSIQCAAVIQSSCTAFFNLVYFCNTVLLNCPLHPSIHCTMHSCCTLKEKKICRLKKLNCQLSIFEPYTYWIKARHNLTDYWFRFFLNSQFCLNVVSYYAINMISAILLQEILLRFYSIFVFSSIWFAHRIKRLHHHHFICRISTPNLAQIEFDYVMQLLILLQMERRTGSWM